MNRTPGSAVMTTISIYAVLVGIDYPSNVAVATADGYIGGV
jgi:hypothetical protein